MVLAIIIIVLLSILIIPRLKSFKYGNMTLITGGIKTGKTALSVHLALSRLRQNRFAVRVQNRIIRILNHFCKDKKPLREMPLLYSNVPIKTPYYVPLTKDMLLRNYRFAYKSVVYFCESSLICDSQYCKDDLTNEQLLLFCKLFAHETRGGTLILDTQSISDNHYAVKRCLSSYLYIHHTIKIPFFMLMYVMELTALEDTQTSLQGDIEKPLKMLLVPKSVWKKYDCYAYSALTDDLTYEKYAEMPCNLKADNIVSLKTFKHLKGGKI